MVFGHGRHRFLSAGQERKASPNTTYLLAEAVRQGCHIIATEPAAALCLTHEYLHLIDDNYALVAAQTSEALSYTGKCTSQGKLQLDFKPVHASLGYHTPCHLRALNVGTPGENLLGLVPGLHILRRSQRGSQGMAGTLGMLHRNSRSSLPAGWGLISKLRNPAIRAGTTECSSCRSQRDKAHADETDHAGHQTSCPGLRTDARGCLAVDHAGGRLLVIT